MWTVVVCICFVTVCGMCFFFFWFFFFFFQAEDGIRDLVRSRGLGDVYKRQASDRDQEHGQIPEACGWRLRGNDHGGRNRGAHPRHQQDHPAERVPVSYTHLTLPTIYSV